MFSNISIKPDTCHGQACVKGTRIPVHQIVKMMANGDSIDDLIREYPTLNRAVVLECLDYVAFLAEDELSPLEAVGGIG